MGERSFHIDRRCVKINEGENRTHVMCTWLYAYRQARRGLWQQVARARSRFQRRIDLVNRSISHILTETHRKGIYINRFAGGDFDT